MVHPARAVRVGRDLDLEGLFDGGGEVGAVERDAAGDVGDGDRGGGDAGLVVGLRGGG